MFHDINYEMTLNGVPLNSVFNSGLCTSCRKKSVMCRIFKRYSLIKDMESIIAKRTFIIKKPTMVFKYFLGSFYNGNLPIEIWLDLSCRCAIRFQKCIFHPNLMLKWQKLQNNLVTMTSLTFYKTAISTCEIWL